MEEISNHREDGTALEVAGGYTVGHNRNITPKKTTRGWKLCVKMKEDFTEWISLKDLKENNPVEISEYVVSNNIDHNPEFLWWVPYTLQKRNPSISKLQKKYWRKKLRFGIEIPDSIN